MTSNTPSLPDAPRRNPWLPTIGLSLWLIFTLGLSLSQWRLVMINGDGDPCLHWRIGHWMIEHRAVLRADVFSHTRAGAPLISKEWLGEILFAAVGDAFGWNGIVLLSAVLIATGLWLLHQELLSEGNDLVLSTVLILLAAMTCSVHWLARPHLFTHLLTIVFTWQLRLYDRGKLPPRRLFCRLVPLMALWANLHGAFFTGLVIIATYVAGHAMAWPTCHGDARVSLRKKLKVLGMLAITCALVTLLNPNGWRLPAHVVEFLRDPLLAHYTNEFRSPDFHGHGVPPFLVELAVVAFTLVLLRPTFSATDVMVIGTWGLLGLFAARNVPVFALVVTPIMAEHWQVALSRTGSGRLADMCRRFSANVTALNRSANGWAIAALIMIVLLGVMAKPRLLGGAPSITSDVLSNRFPVAAVQFVTDNPHAVRGEMFNDYGWGGYLMLVMPDHKVFVDGRNDFYGPELIRDFDDVNRIHPDWNVVLQKYKVGWTILPKGHALNILLSLRGDWTLAYADDVAAIYARKVE